jgi:hypothetical protein
LHLKKYILWIAEWRNNKYLIIDLEMPFPNDDQRNTQESLSKAKRKVLLLQKGATTDHSLKGRTH